MKLNYNKAEFTAAYGKFSQIPAPERIEIAFAGHSNVGKSTLINKLFNRKNLARVSSVPGKTATINFYGLENIYFVDLPGYGYAKVSKSEKERWSGLIEGYLSSDRDIRLVFMLVDMRHAPTKDDVQMVNYLIDTEMPFVLVLTKADKLTRPSVQRDLKLSRMRYRALRIYILYLFHHRHSRESKNSDRSLRISQTTMTSLMNKLYPKGC